jgi:hypothetical protein
MLTLLTVIIAPTKYVSGNNHDRLVMALRKPKEINESPKNAKKNTAE